MFCTCFGGSATTKVYESSHPLGFDWVFYRLGLCADLETSAYSSTCTIPYSMILWAI